MRELHSPFQVRQRQFNQLDERYEFVTCQKPNFALMLTYSHGNFSFHNRNFRIIAVKTSSLSLPLSDICHTLPLNRLNLTLPVTGPILLARFRRVAHPV
jgi:hypothetical protein